MFVFVRLKGLHTAGVEGFRSRVQNSACREWRPSGTAADGWALGRNPFLLGTRKRMGNVGREGERGGEGKRRITGDWKKEKRVSEGVG